MATSGELCQSIATALGIPARHAHEHLRNIREAGEISFKGHGRGAAVMTPLDASKLLITIAGSTFVKDSVLTLAEFRKLRPIGAGTPLRGSSRKVVRPRIKLDEYLADRMQHLIDGREHLPDAYRKRLPRLEAPAKFALTLMSVVGARADQFPRVAVVRHFTHNGVGATSFASPKWRNPQIGAAEYALQLPEAGLIQVRHVPAPAVAEIALSL